MLPVFGGALSSSVSPAHVTLEIAESEVGRRGVSTSVGAGAGAAMVEVGWDVVGRGDVGLGFASKEIVEEVRYEYDGQDWRSR